MKEFLDDFAVKVMNNVNTEMGNEENQNRLTGFAWYITYNNMVSNTHSCPKNGVHNFMFFSDKPRGYPGFEGVIWYRTEKEHEPDNPFHKFPNSLIHTGSGGEGYSHDLWSYYYHYDMRSREDCPKFFSYKYELRFYLMDFPELESMIENERIFCYLKNRDFSISHKFEWIDEETRQRDEAFIQKHTEEFKKKTL